MMAVEERDTSTNRKRLPGLCVPPIPDCSDLLAIPSIKRRGMTTEMIATQMLEDVRYWRAMHPGRDWLAIVPPSWRDYISYNI